MNNWLQNIKGQITELATEVLNDATEEGQVSTTSELQIEKKKSTECELLYLAEKAKCEALEKKLNEQEDQLYSVSIEGDAVKEKFMGMVSDRDEIIRRLEREMERLKFNQESQQGGDFQNIELNSDLIPKEGIEKEISKLKEKHENEISAILAANASNVNLLREDYERRIEQLEAWNALNLTEPVFGNNDKLLDDLNKLKEENNSKNTTISTLSTQIEDKNILIVQLEDKLNKLINEVMEEKNNEEINKLKREKEELLNKIEILENKESIETFKNDLDEKTELALKEAERKLENTEKELNEYKTEKINLLSELEEIKLIYEKNNSSLTEEIKLLNNLIESKQKENENLFEKISNELINVKEDNLKLIEENSFLQKNLNDLMDVKLLLNKSEDKLSKLEEKMVKMEEEHFNEIEQIKQEKNVLLHQIEELSEENKRNDEKLLLIGSEEFKPSSDSETSNNADWEKMGKEEIEGVVSSSTTTSEIKEDSKCDIKYLRKRKIEINEQSIQTDDQLFSSSSNLSENIELKEEISILLNKIDKLEEQLLIEEMNKRKLLLEKEEIFEKFFNKENELIKLKDEFNLIIEEEKKENFKKILEENETFKNKFCEEMDKLRVENDEKFKKTVEDEENQKLSLINENIQLKSLLENKHFECQKYYSKLEEFSQNCQNLNQKLQESLNENLNIQANLEAKNGKIAKLESELTRLKEHLLGIEEISSKEAIAAEERETELRRQLREFKNKFETDESLKEKNLENYKNELEQLKVQLQLLETEKIHLTSILNEKESSLAETKNALLNLQIVLKDLADEQKTEKQRFEGEIRGLKEELKTQNEICKQFLIKEEELKMTKTINLDHLNSLESQLKIKNNLIDELENQLEEFRILQNKKDENFENSSKIITTKKIDETTLKQLFLSFFMAEKSKQPEIAIVMSKILGYNQQEQEQLQKAINSSSYNNNSWFKFGGTTTLPQPFARKEISLTEQFIRFLEQESIDNTRSMLALPETSKRAFLLEESSPSTTTLRSSSSTDLKSILDS